MHPDPRPCISSRPRIPSPGVGRPLTGRLVAKDRVGPPRRVPSSGRLPSPGRVLCLGLFLLLGSGAGCEVEEAAPRTGPQASAVQAGEARSSAAPSLVVLVRHAEKAEAPAQDPPLSAEGEARARALADLLADAGITRIHSTDTRRTLDTARPLARALGVEVERYDARELEAFASHLATLPGRHLVVGHSNTTDRLAGHLGGETFGEIVEAWEYDRLYLLTPAEARWETVLLRFGARAVPTEG